MEDKHLMSQEEFDSHLENDLNLYSFEDVRKYRSVKRAYKRGHLTKFGMLIPKKPYKCKANTCKRPGHHSRAMNEMKRKIYGELRGIV